MIKNKPDMEIAYPVSPDKRTDWRPRQEKAQPISDFSLLPIALNANQVAAVLGISRAGAYNLMRSEGFPTLFIGKRMVVPKERLIAWMNAQVGA